MTNTEKQLKIFARCIECESEFTEEQIANHKCCPNCKTTSIPYDLERDVYIKVNISELSILFHWADNYARNCDNKNLDNPNYKSLKNTINLFAARFKRQFPDKYKNSVLTWDDEMKELKNSNIAKDFSLYIGGKEQI